MATVPVAGAGLSPRVASKRTCPASMVLRREAPNPVSPTMRGSFDAAASGALATAARTGVVQAAAAMTVRRERRFLGLDAAFGTGLLRWMVCKAGARDGGSACLGARKKTSEGEGGCNGRASSGAQGKATYHLVGRESRLSEVHAVHNSRTD